MTWGPAATGSNNDRTAERQNALSNFRGFRRHPKGSPCLAFELAMGSLMGGIGNAQPKDLVKRRSYRALRGPDKELFAAWSVIRGGFR